MLFRSILHKNGTEVNKLQIVAIFRDWRPMEAKKDPEYPNTQVAVLNIPVWTLDEAEAYVKERVALHQLSDPPACNDEERWATPEKWALMKEGGKRATKLYDIKPEEEISKGYYLEHRPKVHKRCQDYCAVNKFCPHFNDVTF